jgi:hypothetical protein
MVGLARTGVDRMLLAIGEVDSELRCPLLGEAGSIRAAVGQGEERE